MILAALLVLIVGGISPFAAGDEPACVSPNTFLLMDRDGATLLVDPRGVSVRELSIAPGVGCIVDHGQALLAGIVPGRWRVDRSSGDEAHRIVVIHRRSGGRVFDVAFDRRIELATAVSSPSGRFTVHVQGNNVASEVTILDAQTGMSQHVRLQHDARLAAFAIGVAISPDETCAAISMERDGGDGAETWLLELGSGDVRLLPVPDAFVLGWVRGQV